MEVKFCFKEVIRKLWVKRLEDSPTGASELLLAQHYSVKTNVMVGALIYPLLAAVCDPERGL